MVISRKQVKAYSYTERPDYTAKTKIARPKAVIPVFPGTNCEYDTAIVRTFGITICFDGTVIFCASWIYILQCAFPDSSQFVQSIARMEKALQDAQMMIFPGGFSFGDELEWYANLPLPPRKAMVISRKQSELSHSETDDGQSGWRSMSDWQHRYLQCYHKAGKMGHSERIGTHIAKNIIGEKDQKIFAAGVSIPF